ncbi:acyl--CoA ligase [bacterium]|nr:acyl--CoA ligase [bacterium]
MQAETFRDLVLADPQLIESAWQFCEALPPHRLTKLVAVCVEDPLRFAFAFLKVLQCGGSPVLMPSPDELRDHGIGVVLDEHGLRGLDGQSVLLPREGSYFAFSSGSTGVRKPLRFDGERALANAQAHAHSLGITAAQTIVQTLRLHHPFGVVAYLFTPLATGARLQVGVYFDSVFPLQGDREDAVVHLTPYHLQFLMRRRVVSPGRIGKLTLGAGPVRRLEALYALGLGREVFTTYGLSEAGPRVTTGKVEAATFVDGWVGRCIDGIQAKVEPDGCLWVNSPYHADDQPPWINTGDRVELLTDGSLVFKNRLQDVLRIRGQTHPRAAYNHRLEQLLRLPCEICQRPYSDALVIFIESARPQAQLETTLVRTMPELRGAEIRWIDNFERTALGKTDLRKMLLHTS